MIDIDIRRRVTIVINVLNFPSSIIFYFNHKILKHLQYDTYNNNLTIKIQHYHSTCAMMITHISQNNLKHNKTECAFLNYNIMRYLIHTGFIDYIHFSRLITIHTSMIYHTKHVKSLKSSHIQRRITDLVLKRFMNLPLTHLNLMRCDNIIDEGLFHLINLPLIDLNLLSCNKITDEGLAYLINLPLTRLDLMYCKNITDKGLAHLIKLPLTDLRLGQCHNITDRGLSHLVNLPLINLILYDCKNITNEGYSHIQKIVSTNFTNSFY